MPQELYSICILFFSCEFAKRHLILLFKGPDDNILAIGMLRRLYILWRERRVVKEGTTDMKLNGSHQMSIVRQIPLYITANPPCHFTRTRQHAKPHTYFCHIRIELLLPSSTPAGAPTISTTTSSVGAPMEYSVPFSAISCATFARTSAVSRCRR